MHEYGAETKELTGQRPSGNAPITVDAVGPASHVSFSIRFGDAPRARENHNKIQLTFRSFYAQHYFRTNRFHLPGSSTLLFTLQTDNGLAVKTNQNSGKLLLGSCAGRVKRMQQTNHVLDRNFKLLSNVLSHTTPVGNDFSQAAYAL